MACQARFESGSRAGRCRKKATRWKSTCFHAGKRKEQRKQSIGEVCRFADLEPGTYAVQARSLGNPRRVSAQLVFELAATGPVLELDLPMLQAPCWQGTITDGAGVPIPGVAVTDRTRLKGPFTGYAFDNVSTSDGQGNYELWLSLNERCIVFADHPAWVWQKVEPQIAPGETLVHEFVLPPASPMTGYVYLPDGTPAAEARVMHMVTTGESKRTHSTRANKDGRFQLGELQRADEFLLRITTQTKDGSFSGDWKPWELGNLTGLNLYLKAE